MRRLSALAVLLALAACKAPSSSAAAKPPSGTELIGLKNLPVAKGQFASSFEIQTVGVEVLAVCRFPRGWHVEAGNAAAADAITGHAVYGASLISPENGNTGDLRGLVLIRPSHASAKPALTATLEVGRNPVGPIDPKIAARVDVGLPPVMVTLTDANIERTPAAACPPPAA